MWVGVWGLCVWNVVWCGVYACECVHMHVPIYPCVTMQVAVSYDRRKVKPGEDVRLTVTAPPSSVVFLLAVDKSVKLLKSGNDITQDMVL